MASVAYCRRRPEQTVLYQVVLQHYQTLVATCEQADRPLPRYVVEHFERYLSCGILSEGFARVHCGGCGYDRLVAFSCKTRAWCPSCLTRRMSDRAAHLVDNVIPAVPIRHWVLSLPPPLRYMLAYDRALCSAVLAAHMRAVFSYLRHKAKCELGLRSVKHAHPGAVTAIQRASSNLALNVHFHSAVTDGVFVQSSSDEPPRFRAVSAPSDAEIAQVAWDTCRRTVALLRKQGRWLDADPDDDSFAQDEPALAHLYAASLQGVLSLGPNAGRRLLRLFGQAAQRGDTSPLVQTPGYGFNLHARQRVSAKDRKGLGRLLRYILRPPVAQDRLLQRPDGNIELRLKRPYSDGTTAILFEPVDFVSKLATQVPPPKMHRLRFFGVFSSHARLRDQVVPKPAQSDDTNCEHPDTPGDEPHHAPGRRLGWAKLMARVWGVDVLQCPRCSSQMQTIAFITEHRVIRRMLDSIGLPADSPTPYPPTIPMQLDLPAA